MEANLDLLLTILPFEKQYYTSSKLQVEYVGHPLMERIPAPSTAPKEKRLIAIFPGSRRKELERNFPLYLEVAKKLLREFPDLMFEISVAHPRFLPLLTQALEKAGLKGNTHIRLTPAAENERLMKTAFLSIAKSGTVTLELALYGVPTVVTYALSSFDYFLAKYIFRIHLPYFALPNLIAGHPVFPELIGPVFTPASLYLQLKEFLAHPEKREEALKGCAEIRALLGSQNASTRAAELILSLLKP
jgi:lipid-A-disaccharide synthase